MKIRWKDWHKQRPTSPGHYLIWSQKYGLRMTKMHPSWWNLPARKAGGERGPRVRLWFKVADLGIGVQLRRSLRHGDRHE